jgi:hypothetical protein
MTELATQSVDGRGKNLAMGGSCRRKGRKEKRREKKRAGRKFGKERSVRTKLGATGQQVEEKKGKGRKRGA